MVLSMFPTPVLALTADAIMDLDGRDALLGLWTVFRKCRHALDNGPRLENIACRLWFAQQNARSVSAIALCDHSTALIDPISLHHANSATQTNPNVDHALIRTCMHFADADTSTFSNHASRANPPRDDNIDDRDDCCMQSTMPGLDTESASPPPAVAAATPSATHSRRPATTTVGAIISRYAALDGCEHHVSRVSDRRRCRVEPAAHPSTSAPSNHSSLPPSTSQPCSSLPSKTDPQPHPQQAPSPSPSPELASSGSVKRAGGSAGCPSTSDIANIPAAVTAITPTPSRQLSHFAATSSLPPLPSSSSVSVVQDRVLLASRVSGSPTVLVGNDNIHSNTITITSNNNNTITSTTKDVVTTAISSSSTPSIVTSAATSLPLHTADPDSSLTPSLLPPPKVVIVNPTPHPTPPPTPPTLALQEDEEEVVGAQTPSPTLFSKVERGYHEGRFSKGKGKGVAVVDDFERLVEEQTFSPSARRVIVTPVVQAFGPSACAAGLSTFTSAPPREIPPSCSSSAAREIPLRSVTSSHGSPTSSSIASTATLNEEDEEEGTCSPLTAITSPLTSQCGGPGPGPGGTERRRGSSSSQSRGPPPLPPARRMTPPSALETVLSEGQPPGQVDLRSIRSSGQVEPRSACMTSTAATVEAPAMTTMTTSSTVLPLQGAASLSSHVRVPLSNIPPPPPPPLPQQQQEDTSMSTTTTVIVQNPVSGTSSSVSAMHQHASIPLQPHVARSTSSTIAVLPALAGPPATIMSMARAKSDSAATSGGDGRGQQASSSSSGHVRVRGDSTTTTRTARGYANARRRDSSSSRTRATVVAGVRRPASARSASSVVRGGATKGDAVVGKGKGKGSAVGDVAKAGGGATAAAATQGKAAAVRNPRFRHLHHRHRSASRRGSAGSEMGDDEKAATTTTAAAALRATYEDEEFDDASTLEDGEEFEDAGSMSFGGDEDEQHLCEDDMRSSAGDLRSSAGNDIVGGSKRENRRSSMPDDLYTPAQPGRRTSSSSGKSAMKQVLSSSNGSSSSKHGRRASESQSDTARARRRISFADDVDVLPDSTDIVQSDAVLGARTPVASRSRSALDLSSAFARSSTMALSTGKDRRQLNLEKLPAQVYDALMALPTSTKMPLAPVPKDQPPAYAHKDRSFTSRGQPPPAVVDFRPPSSARDKPFALALAPSAKFAAPASATKPAPGRRPPPKEQSLAASHKTTKFNIGSLSSDDSSSKTKSPPPRPLSAIGPFPTALTPLTEADDRVPPESTGGHPDASRDPRASVREGSRASTSGGPRVSVSGGASRATVSGGSRDASSSKLVSSTSRHASTTRLPHISGFTQLPAQQQGDATRSTDAKRSAKAGPHNGVTNGDKMRSEMGGKTGNGISGKTREVEAELVRAPQQQGKGRLVLATDDLDEDYETETDDDGEWVSDEDAKDDKVSSKLSKEERDRHHMPPPPPPPAGKPGRHHHQPQAPPIAAAVGPQPPKRPSLMKHRTEPYKLPDIQQAATAVLEQRHFFDKIPQRSYSNLNRTRSGLLSQLMNPNPSIFPADHPYRRNKSLADLNMRMTSATASSSTVAPKARDGGSNGEARPSTQRAPLHSRPVMPLRMTKSSVAVPQASVVTSNPVLAGEALVPRDAAAGAPVRHQPAPPAGGGYRPKGRPSNAELEDETDTESGPEASNRLELSHSLAQERLTALAARTGVAARHGPPPDQSQQRPKVTSPARPSAGSRRHKPALPVTSTAGVQSPPPAPRDIQDPPTHPLVFPYNLPTYAEPSSPRTTRQMMLRTEMSESVRNNLVWARQVNQRAFVGPTRTRSALQISGGHGDSGGGLGDGIKPMTPMPELVKLTAKKRPERKDGGEWGEGSSDNVDPEALREQDSELMFARTRSWAADNYHYAGW